MKKLLGFIVVLATALALHAEPERVSMIVGTSKTVETPFTIESFRVIPNTNKVIVDTSDSTLRMTANAIGEFTVIVEGSGLKQEYSLSVKSNLTTTLKQLRTDLDALTELDIAINEDHITIRGTVTNPEHWQYLSTVLPNYSGKVINYTSFRPSTATLQNLRKMLEKADFTFAEDGMPPTTGQLSMTLAPDAVTITGEMYSEEEIAKIRQILSTQTWLSTDGSVGKDKGVVRGIINLSVINTVLQVDVVYVGVTDSDLSHIGNDGSGPSFSASIGYLRDLLLGSNSASKSLVFGGNMNSTVTFLAQNGLTRAYNAGHVSFSNNDPEGGKLHTGGTTYVKVNGVENGSLQNIEYGLKMNVKGTLVGKNRVRLNLDLTNSSLINKDADSYDIATDTTKQTIICDLNKTIAVAGAKSIAQNTSRSGMPFLRNTPVLRWFVSADNGSETCKKLLILVCPRLNNPDEAPQIEISLDQETKSTYKDAQRDTDEVYEEKNEKFTGFWSWLNWFCW